MLAVVAAALFAIAFVVNASGTSVSTILGPTSLMLAGLTLVALQLAGIGPAYSWRPRRRK